MQKDDFQFMLEDSADVVRKQCLDAIKNLGWKIRSDLTQDYQIFCYVPIADLLPQAPVYSITLYPDGQITYIALVAASDDLSQSHAKNDLPKLKSAIITDKVFHRSPDPTLIDQRITKEEIYPDVQVKLQRKCFISYRRYDSADVVGRIYDRLVAAFGPGKIFKDVDNIPIGADFRKVIDEAVSSCAVLLVVIGRDWVAVTNERDLRRLDDPNDFVRIEIEMALKHSIPIVPLLVREAIMPREEELPQSLQELVYRHGAQIRSDPDFHRDMDRLIQSLNSLLQD